MTENKLVYFGANLDTSAVLLDKAKLPLCFYVTMEMKLPLGTEYHVQ